jgi:hypothetical protein
VESDPFDEMLSLEEKFYDEGHQLGMADGSTSGRIEGRRFGLEKGFEKYLEMGRLHGRSLIWKGRLPPGRPNPSGSCYTPKVAPIGEFPAPISASDQKCPCETASKLAPLPSNSRLEQHLRVLHAVTEPASLSTENTEDSVSDFDDRFKRAQGKIKIIERIVGEGTERSTTGSTESSGNIEDVDILKARH